jgi:phytanoyl-CoA hydroxylase
MEDLSDFKAHYDVHGYVVVPGLFDSSQMPQMIQHYMALRATGPKPGDTGGTADKPDDPNHLYPRMINMHDWDEQSRVWATQRNIWRMVAALLDDEPVLRQTMLYFKPPGARGQALHQDQQYITTDPLLGLWVALDTADAAVGQMLVGAGSHRHGLLPVEKADTQVSFTSAQAVLPSGSQPQGVDMAPGDGLFFSGKCVHGSYANTSADRWRRSFICHYVSVNAQDFVPEQGTHVSHVN